MALVVIDGREINVPAGTLLVEAARRVGIEIPTLCWRPDLRPNNTCMVCLVRVRVAPVQPQAGPDGEALNHQGRFLPACATRAEDGMIVESETAVVRDVRKAALELLLSDHAGQCRAPCQFACPFGTDIPRMLRQIAGGRVADAAATLRAAVPLAAVLSRIGTDACEGACQRRATDEPAAIGLLKRYVADRDLAAPPPYRPTCAAASGKRVAIVGAGAAGLSAAYFLQRAGHACTLFEARPEAGGSLRRLAGGQGPHGLAEAGSALAALAAEIDLIRTLGARLQVNVKIGVNRRLDEIRTEFDAVLIAVGELAPAVPDLWGLPVAEKHLRADRTIRQTMVSGVFAAGDAVRPRGDAVAAAADGKAVAACIDQFLRGLTITGPGKLSALRLPRAQPRELAVLAAASGAGRRAGLRDGVTGLSDEEAQAEAARCLHCDCHKYESCRLRILAERYGADASRYRGPRRRLERILQHPGVVYEPGKCILCGLCVQITEEAREPLGLTYVGRGFDKRVAVPFDEPLSAALRTTARRCVEACPTGALALADEPSGSATVDAPGDDGSGAPGSACDESEGLPSPCERGGC